MDIDRIKNAKKPSQPKENITEQVSFLRKIMSRFPNEENLVKEAVSSIKPDYTKSIKYSDDEYRVSLLFEEDRRHISWDATYFETRCFWYFVDETQKSVTQVCKWKSVRLETETYPYTVLSEPIEIPSHTITFEENEITKIVKCCHSRASQSLRDEWNNFRLSWACGEYEDEKGKLAPYVKDETIICSEVQTYFGRAGSKNNTYVYTVVLYALGSEAGKDRLAQKEVDEKITRDAIEQPMVNSILDAIEGADFNNGMEEYFYNYFMSHPQNKNKEYIELEFGSWHGGLCEYTLKKPNVIVSQTRMSLYVKQKYDVSVDFLTIVPKPCLSIPFSDNFWTCTKEKEKLLSGKCFCVTDTNIFDNEDFCNKIEPLLVEKLKELGLKVVKSFADFSKETFKVFITIVNPINE